MNLQLFADAAGGGASASAVPVASGFSMEII